MTTLLGIIAIAQGITIALMLGGLDRIKARIDALEISRDAQRDRMVKLEAETSTAREIVRFEQAKARLRERVGVAK